MKADKQTIEEDINKITATLEVPDKVIAKIKTGEITHIALNITAENQSKFLENINGHLILTTDEMPDTHYGCFFHNGGEFPYAIRQTLDFIILEGEKDSCLTRIIGLSTKPDFRFFNDGEGKPIREDPEGDCCVWQIEFELVPIPDGYRTYLLRWNPAISSFTDKDFEACKASMVHGMFRMNWSIHEWQEARRGDVFYMMRTAGDRPGIAFTGHFLSDPYPSDDWAGTNKRRMYVDIVCTLTAGWEEMPLVSLEELQRAIPSVDWSEGHSGVLLSEEIVEKLYELCYKDPL